MVSRPRAMSGQATRVWCSHGDHVDTPPPGYRSLASTSTLPVAAFRAEERDETVDIKIRLEVVDLLLAAEDDELDLVEMVKALRKHDGEDLVRVEGEDEFVRIWIDSKSSID